MFYLVHCLMFLKQVQATVHLTTIQCPTTQNEMRDTTLIRILSFALMSLILDIEPVNTSLPHENTNNNDIPIAIQKSSRSTYPPSYLEDFHCNIINHKHMTSATPYFFEKYLSYQAYSPSHKHFLLNVASVYEPSFSHEAVKFQNWRDAMAE